jgi:hypothetical protein|tara:strand:- start:817 stop:1014 length:198 start_codon:yes stop_codon:yes gene_type:complete
MKEHDEINWSGFVRKAIEEKAGRLDEIASLHRQVEKDREIMDWAVTLVRRGRKERAEKRRKKGSR